MKYLVLSVFVVIAVVDLTSARPDDKYTTKYNNVDIDEILHSDRLLRSYINCLLGEKKCTPDAAELKKVLPEALENKCAKCAEEQRNVAIKVIRFLIDNKRPWWNELSSTYDKDGKYLKKYEEEAKKENIKL